MKQDELTDSNGKVFSKDNYFSLKAFVNIFSLDKEGKNSLENLEVLAESFEGKIDVFEEEAKEIAHRIEGKSLEFMVEGKMFDNVLKLLAFYQEKLEIEMLVNQWNSDLDRWSEEQVLNNNDKGIIIIRNEEETLSEYELRMKIKKHMILYCSTIIEVRMKGDAIIERSYYFYLLLGKIFSFLNGK